MNKKIELTLSAGFTSHLLCGTLAVDDAYQVICYDFSYLENGRDRSLAGERQVCPATHERLEKFGALDDFGSLRTRYDGQMDGMPGAILQFVTSGKTINVEICGGFIGDQGVTEAEKSVLDFTRYLVRAAHDLFDEETGR